MNFISKVILEIGVTKKYICEKADISRTYLYYIENDKRTPSVKTMKKLSLILRTPVQELFFKDEEVK
ncbi:helix-turn-helix transcriptional regulator [Clostridium sp.]|uniref:helix-turn-helix transcriptional regulator n=1 Tax=Clostridium sp. TaxID=1506 RepID=UPI003D6CDA1E